MTISMTAQAQSSITIIQLQRPQLPLPTPGTTVGQTGFWQRTRGNQVVWYTYSPQYYQTAYPVQTPQTYNTTQYAPATYQTQPVQAPVATQTPAVTTNEAAPTETTAPAATVAGDPYGPVGWLNVTRAAYGLSPRSAYDANPCLLGMP